ncbi:hypothetical protein [Deinococcus pimensis]|uniref:hypothetical protein n=1 Tax=Deinococcus pimensis TaxID=309888 RepID=UPI0004B5490E|nr:hypothetical protein [Deinococcus pimensis]
MRYTVTAALVTLAVTLPPALAAPTFTIDGRAVSVPTVEQGGKVYADVAALARALGATVTYDAAKKAYVVTTARTGAAAQTPAVQGTTQQAGGAGELGRTYTLGKLDPLNFTLRSAAYGVARVSVGDGVIVPNADEKLLVLRYTVQNPQKSETNFYWGSLKFTAVDARDVSHAYERVAARDGTTESLQLTLKPAQKIDVVAVVKVPASGVVPKLIVEREDGSPVLRYDLRGKVSALPAPLADPADPSGATARTTVPANAGTYVPMGLFDARLDGVTFAKSAGDLTPADGRRFLVATFTLRNTTNAAQDYYWGSFGAQLGDADGEDAPWRKQLLKATRDEDARGSLKPGEEYRVRFLFELPENVAGKTLTLREGDSRAYEFDVSAAK